jgi:hypothetical protein
VELSLLKSLGQIAGLGGLSVGVVLLVFRNLLRQRIFPRLDRAQAYSFMNRIALLTWLIGVGCIAAWTWIETRPAPLSVHATDGIASGGSISINGGVTLGSTPNNGSPPVAPTPGVRAEGGIAAGRDVTINGPVSIDASAPTKP